MAIKERSNPIGICDLRSVINYHDYSFSIRTHRSISKLPISTIAIAERTLLERMERSRRWCWLDGGRAARRNCLRWRPSSPSWWIDCCKRCRWPTRCCAAVATAPAIDPIRKQIPEVSRPVFSYVFRDACELDVSYWRTIISVNNQRWHMSWLNKWEGKPHLDQENGNDFLTWSAP